MPPGGRRAGAPRAPRAGAGGVARRPGRRERRLSALGASPAVAQPTRGGITGQGIFVLKLAMNTKVEKTRYADINVEIGGRGRD